VVTLSGRFPTLDAATAHELMEKAHQVCPYSRATRGNIEVTLTVTS
jgi:organic hydroperoxide reductase OsmC/OhrA